MPAIDPVLEPGADLVAMCSDMVSRRGEVGPEKYELAEPFLEFGSAELELDGETGETGDFGLEVLENVKRIARRDARTRVLGCSARTRVVGKWAKAGISCGKGSISS